MMRPQPLAAVLLLVCSTDVLCLPQRPGALPGHMKLDGDPAATLDLGAFRILRVGRRSGPDGPVEGAPYLCRAAVLSGRQKPPAGSHLPETLLGRPIGTVLPWLEGLSEAEPVILAADEAVVVALLAADAVADLQEEEVARLRVFFPDLEDRPRKLEAEQLAHLWTLRLLATEAALADLLGLDEEGRMERVPGGHRPLGHHHYEVYLFSDDAVRDDFAAQMFPDDSRPLEGTVIAEGALPVPVAAVHVGDAFSARRVAYSTTCLSLERRRRMVGGVPPWLRLGMAHFMERRVPAPARGRGRSGTLPGEERPPRRWKRVVKDVILERKAPTVAALTAAPARALDRRHRIVAWSIVRYLVGVGRERFATLLRHLYHADPSVLPAKAVLDALRAAYGVDLQGLDRAWQGWARSVR